MPEGSNESTAERITMTAENRVEADFSISAPSVLRGSVNGGARPLEDLHWNYRVIALRADSSLSAEESWSADRSWELTLADHDPVRLYLRIGEIGRWLGGRSFQEAPFFYPVPAETLVVPEEEESGLLVHIGGMAAELVDPPRIELRDSSGVLLGTSAYVERGQNWHPIRNLAPGTIFLRFTRENENYWSPWSAFWYDGAARRENATGVRIATWGDLVEVDVELPPAAIVRGRVRENSVTPSIVARLFSEADTLHPLVQRTLRDGSDRFEFRGMDMGGYRLSVWMYVDKGFVQWWYPGTWLASEAEVIQVTSFGQILDLEWESPQ